MQRENSNKPTLTILYGAPCAGKSTCIRELQLLLPFEYLPIESIWNSVPRSQDFTEADSKLVFEKLLATIECQITLHKHVLVEGIFASNTRWKVLDTWTMQNDLNLIAIRLHLSEQEMIRRLIHRNAAETSKSIPLQRAQWLWRQFERPPDNHYLLDSETNSPAALTKDIFTILTKRGVPCANFI